MVGLFGRIRWGAGLRAADFNLSKPVKAIPAAKLQVTCMYSDRFCHIPRITEKHVNDMMKCDVAGTLGPNGRMELRVNRNESTEAYVCADGMIEGKMPDWWLFRVTINGSKIHSEWRKIFILD